MYFRGRTDVIVTKYPVAGVLEGANVQSKFAVFGRNWYPLPHRFHRDGSEVMEFDEYAALCGTNQSSWQASSTFRRGPACVTSLRDVGFGG